MVEKYKQYEPLFGEWRISKLIGKGSFGEVYEIERDNFGTIYKAALKIIAIPVDESELQELMSSGMSVAETKQYIKQSAKEIVNEFVLMSKLKGNTNIVSYEDHQVIEHEDKLGWDIMMKMELLEPINKYIKQKGLTKKDLIKLGIDLCMALELCEKYNIVHRDIKPENIFVSPNGDFKLGDFGIARSIEKSTLGLSKKGTYTYMAPEVYKGESYTTTVDIYSLGIVMYKLMNCNRIPFMPPYPQPIVYTDRENALTKRVKGEKLPVPAGIKEGELTRIVLKACQFDSKDRYQTAVQMREELMKLLDTEEDAVLLTTTKETDKPKGKKKGKQKNKQVKRASVEERVEENIGENVETNIEEKEEIEKTLLIDKEELPPVKASEVNPLKDTVQEKRRLAIIGALVVIGIGVIAAVSVLLGNYNKLKTQESLADSKPIKTITPASPGVIDDNKDEQALTNEEIKPEEVKPTEEVKPVEQAKDEKQDQTALEEKTPEPEKEVKEEKAEEKSEEKVKETPKTQEKVKTDTQTPVKDPVKTDTQKPAQETPMPTQATPKPNKPPEIYIDFEE